MPEWRQLIREASDKVKAEAKERLTGGRKGLPYTAAAGLAAYNSYTLPTMVSNPEIWSQGAQDPELAAPFMAANGTILMTYANWKVASADLRDFDKMNAARDAVVETTGKLRSRTISKRAENEDFFDLPEEWKDDGVLADTPEDEFKRRAFNAYHENPLDFLVNPGPYLENAMMETQSRVNSDRVDTDMDHLRSSAARPYQVLPEDIYRGVVEGVENTFQKSNIRNIQSFGSELKSSETETIKEFIQYLDSDQKDANSGYRLVNIGKDISYLEFFEDGELLSSVVHPEESDLIRKLGGSPIMPETLQGTARLVLGGETASVDPDEFVAQFEYQDTSLAETSQGQVLTQLVAERSAEMGEVERLAEMAGINPQWDAAKKVKGLAYQDREVDPDELAKMLDKEIQTKRAEYTEQATINQGKEIVDSMYEEITGESKDSYNNDELAALKAHLKFDRNRDAVEQVLRHNKGVYQRGANRKWLDSVDIDEDMLIDFDTREYGLEGERSYDVQERRDELLDEMQQHVARLEGLADDMDIAVDEFRSIGDFERYAEETDPELEGEAERLYQEVFDEKIREYHDLAIDTGGNGKMVEVGLATPLETMRTGSHFSTSCLAIEKTNGWSAAADAVDVNKQTVYVWDENDNVLGRALVTVTKDDTMSNYSFYTNDERVEPALQDYIQDYSQTVGLPLERQNTNVATLEADAWYSSAR